jgi:hypothetical protein
MTAMASRIETLICAALLIVSACVVFVSELRVPAMHFALFTLVLLNAAMFTWRLRASGMLGLTPKGILHSRRRPQVSLLFTVATWMSVVAVVVISLR